MERLVTTPLEITLAGMPGLKATHSKSLFGLTHLRNVFHYGVEYDHARQEVINRLAMINQPLPTGVTPQISPASPIGEIFRYTLKSPRDAVGNEIYTLNDLKALQDWLVEREFRRVPRIIDVTSYGGTVKRYEIQPDPDRLKRFGITLAQLSNALANSNANVGGEYLIQGRTVKIIRCIGVIGGGKDPMEATFAMKSPEEAAKYLRDQEKIRCEQIRDIVITSNNYGPVRVDDIVQGGPLPFKGAPRTEGVIVSNQTRLGRVSQDRAMWVQTYGRDFGPHWVRKKVPEKVLADLGPLKGRDFKEQDAFSNEVGKLLSGDERNRYQQLVINHAVNWRSMDVKVQCVVLMRKGEQSLPSLEGVKAKVEVLNKPGRLLPGVQLEPYYDREELVHLTTHTVTHNLLVGIALVTMILLMFLSNVRTALIVAVNIPLALLFAFTILYIRGKSANLLSIGAVDFGIIVDSAVIMVENVYRHLASGEHSELPLKDRILRSCSEIDRALLFSTGIMVCAFIPLFTMHGAEGELFGPMGADLRFRARRRLAFGVDVYSGSVSFVFPQLEADRGEFPGALLEKPLPVAIAALSQSPGGDAGSDVEPGGDHGGVAFAASRPRVHARAGGREPLDPARVFPVHVSLDASMDPIKKARAIMRSASYPEVDSIVVQMGRPDDGTDPGAYNNVEIFAPLKPETAWPVVKRPNGEYTRRTRHEIVSDMSAELEHKIPGVEWAFSQYIRDNVMECISGVKGDNSVKIYGPDLNRLEELAEWTKKELAQIPGLHDLGIYHVMGQSNFEFVVDQEKCKRWGVQTADVDNVINTAVHGNPLSQMIEGEKTFDITLRWPGVKRQDETSILEIPVDIGNVNLTPGFMPGTQQTPFTGGASGPTTGGTSVPYPAHVSVNIASFTPYLPRLRLKDLVSPVDDLGQPNPTGSYTRPGGSMITREQGKRFIAVKFSVREDRDLASAVEDVKTAISHKFTPPYRVEFGGEFEQMEDAEGRAACFTFRHPWAKTHLHAALPRLPFASGRRGDPVERF